MKKVANFILGLAWRMREECRAGRRLYLFRRPLALLLLAYCAGLLVAKKTGFLDRVPPLDPVRWEGRPAAVTGVVLSHPDPRPKGCVYLLRVETVSLFGEAGRETHSAAGTVLLHLAKASESLAGPGDRLRARGRLRAPRASKIPGTFDYADYLGNRGIHSLLYTSAASVENLGPSGFYRPTRAGWTLKRTVIGVFNRNLTPPQAAVLAGLVVGSRPRFHPEIKRIFVESGTMHILVASGSNAAFVVGLWFLFARLLFRLKRAWALGTSLPAVWLYVLLVGMEPPILRAGIMASVAILAYLTAREDRAYHALTVAALVTLVSDPRALFDVGFQMSFTTVFGMLYFLPHLDPWMAARRPVIKWALRLAAATLTAQIWLAPLTAAVFKRFFPIGLLSNLVMIPLAAFGLAAGLALAVLDFAHGTVPWFSRAIGAYVQILIDLARFFADHPGKSFWTASPSGIWIAGFYLACFSVVGLKRFWMSRLAFAAAVIMLAAGSWLGKPGRRPETKSPETTSPAALTVTWIDVGRRLSVLIQTSDNHNILINPGTSEPFDAAERILMPYLSERRVRALDAVILAGADPKQTSGLDSLHKSLEVKTVVDCRKARRFYSWGGLKLEVLPGSKSLKTDAPLWITYGKARLLLAHVLPLKTQDELLRRGVRRVDVFQGRFSEKLRWRADFVGGIKPKTLIETGFVSEKRPTRPPWPDRQPIVPQKLGWYELKISRSTAK